MAISIVNVTTNTDAATATFTITKPAGLANGDVLFAWIAKNEEPTITDEADWTQVFQDNGTGGQDRSGYFGYKVITDASAEGADYSWTATSNMWSGTIIALRGVHTDVLDQTTGHSIGLNYSNSKPNPSITTQTANSMIMCGLMLTHNTVTAFAPPSGMAEQSDLIRGSGGFGAHSSVATVLQAAVGASGTKQFTVSGLSATEEYIMFTAAIKEAESSGTNTQINIGDAWKDVAAMQINIGDAWKNITGAQINIGDSWKTIF